MPYPLHGRKTLRRKGRKKHVNFDLSGLDHAEEPYGSADITLPSLVTMPSSSDPRSYIKSQTLPIPSQKGLRIQARSSVVYNPTLPTRNEVRDQNYRRRQQQMTSMGFTCVAHKPYQGIGDPFYLDQKKMILHALGQWNEDMESSSCSSDSEDEDDYQADKAKPMTAAKFVLRRGRKDLNNLNRSLAHGRNMMRNVRLGHSLFHMVNKEILAKKEAVELEIRRKQERLRTECQPPKMDSSSGDETDEDLENDVDLRQFMVSRATTHDEGEKAPADPSDPTADADLKSRVVFQGPETCDATSEVPKSSSAKSRHRSPGGKKRQPPPRPYTPQHSNIAVEDPDVASEKAMFRQLCALYWLLEAMNIEPPHLMGSIATCWSLRDIGGTRTTVNEQAKEKSLDSDWRRFISNRHNTKVNVFKRLTAPRGSNMAKTPRKLSANRMSISSSTSDIGNKALQPATTKVENPIQEEDETSAQGTTGTEEEEDVIMSKSLFSFLDEYYESLRREREAEEAKEAQGNERPPEPAQPDLSQNHHHHHHHERKHKHRHRDKSARATSAPPSYKKALLMSTAEVDQMNRQSMDASSRSPHGGTYSARGSRMDYVVRPKSSAAVLEFQEKSPSNRLKGMPSEMRQKFTEVQEEQALIMHEAIEAIDRQRLKVMQNKFRYMPTGGSSFHRAIRQMRSKSRLDDESADQHKKKAVHQQWYAYLLENIPIQFQQDWFVSKILQKIGKYGSVESSKQSAYKFLKVLSGLRTWEICNPDISAAIEFCREKIIEMSVEEYEEWFTQTFREVERRPQTAPAAMSKESRREAQRLSVNSSSRLVPSSAPPRAR